jgi:hypothetical protein
MQGKMPNLDHRLSLRSCAKSIPAKQLKATS